MKNLYALVLSGAMCFSASAQISTYPYVESFDANSQCTGWTVTTGTWYHNTTNGTIEVDNHNQTNVHAYLYSPWFNTTSLSQPVIRFDIRITADDSTGCVPELDLGYDDSVNVATFNALQMNMACNRNCTGGLSAYAYVPDGYWRVMEFDVVRYAHMKFEFNSVFQGTGMFEIRNMYVGEKNATTGVTVITDNQINAYPNPVSDKLHLPITSGFIALTLSDVIGNIVYSVAHCESDVIDVSTLSNGIYLLHIATERESIDQKISVRH
jgi:hypothetical protein